MDEVLLRRFLERVRLICINTDAVKIIIRLSALKRILEKVN